MSSASNIEWTDCTWNPVVGCTPVSPGCLNCYAATMARRLEAMGVKEYAAREIPATMGTPYDAHEPAKMVRIAEVKGGRAVFSGEVRCVPERLGDPLSWRKPRRVFVNSMSDLFHEDVPDGFIDWVWETMYRCPQHTFQILTKRPDRMAAYFDGVRKAASRLYGEEMIEAPLPNVWLGTSVEDQKCADERVPWLLKCPAAVRFLSCEPLLGPVNLVGAYRTAIVNNQRGGMTYTAACKAVAASAIHWVIVGGESGSLAKVRPCDVGWVRSIVRQCRDAGVACFVKQLGAKVVCRNDEVADWMDQPGGPCLDDINTEGVVMQGDPVRVLLRDRKGGDPAEWPEDLRVREMPKGCDDPDPLACARGSGVR